MDVTEPSDPSKAKRYLLIAAVGVAGLTVGLAVGFSLGVRSVPNLNSYALTQEFAPVSQVKGAQPAKNPSRNSSTSAGKSRE